MWNTWTSQLLALPCPRPTETKLPKASLGSSCLLLRCTFLPYTSILHLLMSVTKWNNSSGCSCTRHPTKKNAWWGSSQCFTEHSSLEVCMVRSSSQHLHTMKWILNCAWGEPQMIIDLSKISVMSAMSAISDLKNAYFFFFFLVGVWFFWFLVIFFNFLVGVFSFFFFLFLVLILLSHVGPWNHYAKQEENRSFVSLLIYRSLQKKQAQGGKAGKEPIWCTLRQWWGGTSIAMI